MLPHNLICFGLAILISDSMVESVWCDVFHDADITYVFTPAYFTKLDVEADFPYFQAVRQANLYAPFRTIVLYSGYFGLFSITRAMDFSDYKYHDIERTARYRTIFFPLDSTTGSSLWNKFKCEYLIYLASVKLLHEYVFAQIFRHRHASDGLTNISEPWSWSFSRMW